VNSLIHCKLDRLIRIRSDRHSTISKGIGADSCFHFLKLIDPYLVSNEVRFDTTLTYYVSFKLMILPLMKVGRGWLPIKV
jgi:hypothetical protein